jgi:GNAT superfamily N-acetyltransferase
MPGATVRALDLMDADQALLLYNELTVGPKATDPSTLAPVIDHPGTQVLGCFLENELVAMATLHLLPNVVWNARPYALVENFVTRATSQRQGYGRQVMEAVIAAAWSADASKIMLMTGTGRDAIGFYEACGFSTKDKTAMVLRRA